MNSRGQRAQTENESRRGSIQKFVSNPVNTPYFRSLDVFPSAIVNDLFQRNAVARSAPGGDDYVGVLRENGFSRWVFSRSAYEFSAGCSDQLCHPRLRRDQWLAPFLAKYARTLCTIRLHAD